MKRTDSTVLGYHSLSNHTTLMLNISGNQIPFWVFLSNVLTKWHSDTANRLCTMKPPNKGDLGASAIQHAKI